MVIAGGRRDRLRCAGTAVGWFARSGTSAPGRWLAVTVNAITGSLLIPWSIADVPVEGLGIGGWAQSLALVTVAALAPPLLSAAILRETLVPPFSRIIGPNQERARDFLGLSAGFLLIALMLLAIQSALGLVFDPRYRDFPFAPLTAATAAFLLHSLIAPRAAGGYAKSKNSRQPACWRCRCLISCSTRVSPIGSRCGCVRRLRPWHSF